MSSHVRKYMALFLMNQCFVVGIFNLRGSHSFFFFHNGEEMVLWRTAVQQWIEVSGQTKKSRRRCGIACGIFGGLMSASFPFDEVGTAKQGNQTVRR